MGKTSLQKILLLAVILLFFNRIKDCTCMIKYFKCYSLQPAVLNDKSNYTDKMSKQEKSLLEMKLGKLFKALFPLTTVHTRRKP
jgi:hypothetical protein